jgi:hypothetical protein
MFVCESGERLTAGLFWRGGLPSQRLFWGSGVRWGEELSPPPTMRFGEGGRRTLGSHVCIRFHFRTLYLLVQVSASFPLYTCMCASLTDSGGWAG